jgi:CheY-like chemotaxis protein
VRSDSLEELGYTVLQATNASEAISLLQRYPEIRIVFTDVQMPGTIDGLMLADAVNKRWPPVKLFITSAIPLSRPAQVGAEFIPKLYVFANIKNLFAATLAA